MEKRTKILIGTGVFVSLGIALYFYQKSKIVPTDITWQINTQVVTPLPQADVPVFDDTPDTLATSQLIAVSPPSTDYGYNYNYGYY